MIETFAVCPECRGTGYGDGLGVGTLRTMPRPCSAGQGTRGGTSRGKGSGSRLLKVQCGECGYLMRITRKWLDLAVPDCPLGHGTMREEA